MGRLLVYLGRLILIIVGFLCAALAASAAMHLLVLPILGFRSDEAAAVTTAAFVFSIPFVALFVAYFALTPSLVVIAIAELWSVRGWLFHALGGGAVGLALAVLFGSAGPMSMMEYGVDMQPMRPVAEGFDLSLLAVMIGSGMVGGLVYWLVAGSTSGSWKRAAQTKNVNAVN